MKISRTAFAALAAASLLSACSALQTSTTGGGDAPPARSGRAANGLAYSAASADTVQAMPVPGACHYRGRGLFAQPDPHCAPGALNPAVTQQNIGRTICRPGGHTASVRPPERVTERGHPLRGAARLCRDARRPTRHCPARNPSGAGPLSTFTPGPYDIELASGRFLDLSDPDASVIGLEDVAWGLSHTCRFAGQCRTTYSVAEHALLVASRLELLGHDRAVCMAGLHHDDAEAFVGDVTQPLKHLLGEYRAIEASVFAAVVEALNLQALPFNHPAVKDTDIWALAHEARDLMPSRGESWWTAGRATGELAAQLGLMPEIARSRWLDRHRTLISGCVSNG